MPVLVLETILLAGKITKLLFILMLSILFINVHLFICLYDCCMYGACHLFNMTYVCAVLYDKRLSKWNT